jgi:hypothetical protein
LFRISPGRLRKERLMLRDDILTMKRPQQVGEIQVVDVENKFLNLMSNAGNCVVAWMLPGTMPRTEARALTIFM